MEDHFDNTEHPYVTSVPDAGRTYFNLGRGASYEAARRGEIPTIRGHFPHSNQIKFGIFTPFW